MLKVDKGEKRLLSRIEEALLSVLHFYTLAVRPLGNLSCCMALQESPAVAQAEQGELLLHLVLRRLH